MEDNLSDTCFQERIITKYWVTIAGSPYQRWQWSIDKGFAVRANINFEKGQHEFSSERSGNDALFVIQQINVMTIEFRKPADVYKRQI